MRRLIISVTFLYLFALTGCAPKPTIAFSVFGDPAELAAYQQLVAEFEARHPDIDVQLRHIPSQSEYRQRLAADFSGGQPADVFLLNYRRFAVYAAEGALEPLGPYLADSPVIAADDFFGPTIEAFTLDGQLWCVPQNVSSLVVYYNRTLFDAAGLPYPADDWTWDDFLQSARALTQDLDGDGRKDQYGASIAPNLFRLAPLVWQNGGRLVDDPAHPTRLALDSPAALEALQWLVNLQVAAGVVPDALAEAAESSESRFLNGRLAMMFNSRRGVPTYRTITGFAWDVAPLPRGKRQAGILHSDGYCMAAATKNKQAAWTFIEFANSVEGQSLVAASGRTVPSLRAVANSAAFLDGRPPEHSRVFIDTIPTLGRVPVMPGWAAIEEAASKEIERAFYGHISAEEAARIASEMTRPYFELDLRNLNSE